MRRQDTEEPKTAGPLESPAQTRLEDLPESLPQMIAAGPRALGKKASDLKGRKILVAEDSMDKQALIRVYFAPSGADLYFAENGAEALQVANESYFDLIVMDIQMPVMDGFETVAKHREGGWAGPIMALSAHVHQSEIERALQNGFDAYVTKPIDRTLLWQ